MGLSLSSFLLLSVLARPFTHTQTWNTPHKTTHTHIYTHTLDADLDEDAGALVEDGPGLPNVLGRLERGVKHHAVPLCGQQEEEGLPCVV
jgi:hypothetical protein